MSLICALKAKELPKRLPRARAGRYSGKGYVCSCFEEALREGACPLPVRESVLRLSRGHLCRQGAGVSPRRRQPGGATAALQNHRGEGGRRPPDHSGGRAQGSHPDGRQRAEHPRSAVHLLRQLSSRLLSLALPLAVLLGGCDVAQPEPPAAAGPAVQLLAMYPPDGCGVGVDPDCAPVPVNASIKLRFDRFLDTATINRQAIQVYTGDPKFSPSITFQVDYDPVERVVEFRVPPGQALKPQTLYQLVLSVAKDAGDFGIRAFDGAPLAEADLPLQTSFFTGTAAVDQPADVVPSCATIVGEVFNTLGA